MLKETVPSIWSSMVSWFTPTFLFLLLNLVIGIIAVTSAFGSRKHKHHQQQQQPRSEFHHQQQQQQPIARAPSSVLERLKSINLYHFRSEDLNPFSTFHAPEPVIPVTSGFLTQDHHHQQQHPQLARAPSILERLTSINLYHFKTEDFNPFPTMFTTEQQPSELTQHHQKQDLKSTQVRKQSKKQNPDHDFLNHRTLNKNKHRQQAEEFQQPPPQLARAPSILERLKSINLYNFKPEDFNPFPTTNTTESSVTQHQKTVLKPTQVRKESRDQNPDHDFLDHRALNKNNQSTQHQKTVLKPTPQVRKESGDQNPDHDFLNHRALNKNKSAKTTRPKMKKLETAKSHIGLFRDEVDEESRVVFDDEPQRPSTVKENKSKASDHQADEEVDAKADDFINRFKNQLKLQRLDSILQYKDMLSRGAGK